MTRKALLSEKFKEYIEVAEMLGRLKDKDEPKKVNNFHFRRFQRSFSRSLVMEKHRQSEGMALPSKRKDMERCGHFQH